MNQSSLHDGDELLSARFDGEAAESSPSSADEELIFARWRALSTALRSIPVVPAGLADSVMQQITKSPHQAERVVVTRVTRPRATTARSRGRAVLTATMASVMLLSASLVWYSNGIGDPLRLQLAQIHNQLLPQNWDVFVVTVPADREFSVDGLFNKRTQGPHLKLQRLPGDSSSQEGPELVVASSEVSESLRNVLSVNASDLQTTVNPDSIGNLSREELLHRVAKSLQSPTLSEQHFGRVYMVVPEQGTLVVRSVENRDADVETVIAEHGTASSGRTDHPAGTVRSGAIAATAGSKGRPVVVVIVRKPADAVPDHQSSNSTQIFNTGV